ncbi:MAG: hypothetical protein BM557_03710 [Flavobacterium sp. MedPE-SWcel]|uniref:hypothetical protein n=1 Tax=uncultured Flavobacterium sp. TaxID=165435 RepID=UPI0009194A50|nr:hypothetical protein [uncultured Flavobacterium sp.]OIQ21367.1 MAG: hypothetical protein BM557_03710 [Flavobacterium sp. MedPE-SWcel]
MRKTIFILSTVIISGFLLMSVGTPSLNKGQLSNKDFSEYTTFSDTLSWKLLGRIKYEKKASKDYPGGIMYPIINETLKTKNKKEIVMSGFIIPIDNKNYALSKNVFASCFFCGQAGPETVMGIKFEDESIRLKTDQYVTLKGNFRYNDSDVDDWVYHIENAIIVKGE